MSDIINVFHADGGEPARIGALEEIPKILDMGRARQLYTEQGQILADALWSALPGGTLDVLIARLLERRASLFRVPFGEPNIHEQLGGWCDKCGRGNKAQGETG